VANAYALSVSATGRLLSLRKMDRVNRLLNHLGSGKPLDRCFDETLGLSLATFEADWKWVLERQHGAP
jgi:hypothetical protein